MKLAWGVDDTRKTVPSVTSHPFSDCIPVFSILADVIEVKVKIKSWKQPVGHPFSWINPADKWEVDRNPVLTLIR